MRSATGASVHDKRDDESGAVSTSTPLVTEKQPSIPVKTQDFSENENEDHADEDPRLAHEGTHTLC